MRTGISPISLGFKARREGEIPVELAALADELPRGCEGDVEPDSLSGVDDELDAGGRVIA
jgi:hypothetical protein